MATVRVTLTRDDVSPALMRLLMVGRDTTPLLRAMGTTFKSITERNFNSSGSAMRPAAWAPKSSGGASNLKKSGLLWHSFHLTVSKDQATLSNPTPYAAIHQFGGTIRGNPLLRFKIGDQWVSTESVTIPARPFFPIRDGALTPAAQQLVAAAARRVIERTARAQ